MTRRREPDDIFVPSSRRQRIARLLPLPALLLFTAATTALVWDYRKLKVTPGQAAVMLSTVAEQRQQDRINAVAILLREGRAAISALQDAAAGTGPEAEQAALALGHIRKQLAR